MDDYIDRYVSANEKTRLLYERAAKTIPGGVSHNLRYHRPFPLFFKDASGPLLVDVDGHEYVDLWMGHYSQILGHGPKCVRDAILPMCGSGTQWGVPHEGIIRLVEKAVSMMPGDRRMRLTVTGTEATMYAIRLARAHTGRQVTVKMRGGWHGANDNLSHAIKAPFDKAESMGLPDAGLNDMVSVDFNEIEETRIELERLGDRLAAVIVEPVIGSGGFIPASKQFMEMLRQTTRKLGALLIFDEIITGFRLGTGGAQEYFGIQADLVTLGKILGGGFALSAITGRADILEASSPASTLGKSDRVLIGGGTFSEAPLACAAGLAVLKYLDANRGTVYSELERKGETLRSETRKVFEKAGVCARVTGVGSLMQVHFPFQPDCPALRGPHDLARYTDLDKRENEYKLRMMANGVFVMHGGGALSSAHGDEHIERILRATEQTAREMAKGG